MSGGATTAGRSTKLVQVVAGARETGEAGARETYAGYTALDPLGRKIGKVKRLFTDGHGVPTYVMLQLGLFGTRAVLIPAQAVIANAERRTLTLGKL